MVTMKNIASTFNLAGVYATEECFGVTHVLGGSDVTMNGTIQAYAEENIKGKKAFDLYGLDFDNYWVAWSGTPMLASFWEGEFTPDADQPHTGWYLPNATEMTLMTTADLYGFAKLSATDNFAGKTVKLGADIGIVLMMVSNFGAVLESEALKPAFDQLLPALFGGLAVVFVSKNFKIAIAPMVLMLAAFIFTPLTSGEVGIMAPVGVIFTLVVARIMYKKGII